MVEPQNPIAAYVASLYACRATANAGVGSARARSWMVAIYQANPRAFARNMNLLRSGAVLRIPDEAAAGAISGADANAEIRRQYAAWRGASGSGAAAK